MYSIYVAFSSKRALGFQNFDFARTARWTRFIREHSVQL
jgi:hypothetical protein